MRANFRLIDDNLRDNPTANRLFLRLLTDSRDPEGVLRKMNEAGVLGRFIRDFGRVVSMMQFNMYHHFTVDEHLIRTIGFLSGIERGKLRRSSIRSRPRSSAPSTIAARSTSRPSCTTSPRAATRITRSPAPASPASSGRVSGSRRRRPRPPPGWSSIISSMSLFAQSRDLNDPKTIRDFADLVQSRERLKLLLLLTVADIRAVGPGVWTGWKGQLLRTLYFETEPLLGGGHTTLEPQRARGARPGCAARAAGRLAEARPRALHRPPLPVLLAAGPIST